MPVPRSVSQRSGFLSSAIDSASDALRAIVKGVTIRLLTRGPLPSDRRREVLVVSIQMAPGVSTGLHDHPGDEFATLMQGEIELLVDGEDPRVVRAGDAYHIPEGVTHQTRVTSSVAARTITTYVITRGHPIARALTADQDVTALSALKTLGATLMGRRLSTHR